MSLQYARLLSEKKRLTFKQVGVPDKELLKNLYIFIVKHPPSKKTDGIGNFRKQLL